MWWRSTKIEDLCTITMDVLGKTRRPVVDEGAKCRDDDRSPDPRSVDSKNCIPKPNFQPVDVSCRSCGFAYFGRPELPRVFHL